VWVCLVLVSCFFFGVFFLFFFFLCGWFFFFFFVCFFFCVWLCFFFFLFWGVFVFSCLVFLVVFCVFVFGGCFCWWWFFLCLCFFCFIRPLSGPPIFPAGKIVRPPFRSYTPTLFFLFGGFPWFADTVSLRNSSVLESFTVFFLFIFSTLTGE